MVYRYIVKAFCLAVISNVCLSLPGNSAEKIVLNYSIFSFSIPVESLDNFAKTGTVDQKLRPYLGKVEPENLEKIRSTLNQSFEIKPFTLYQLTKTYAGVKIIHSLGKTIQMPQGTNGFYAIRSSMVESALSDEGLTMINFIRNFPNDLHINLAHIFSTLKKVNTLVKDTDNFINQLEKNQGITFDPDDSLFPHRRGKFSVTKQVRVFTDVSRQRNLQVAIYLPEASPDNMGVILISSGLGAHIDRFQQLAEHLTSHGFAVVVVDHPQSNYERQQAFYQGYYSEPFDSREFIDRPMDISFVLDRLEELNKTEFSQQLNLEQVGIFGYSFGFTTSLSLAGAKINWTQLQQDCQALDEVGNINISLYYQCRALELPSQEYNLYDKRIQAIFGYVPFGLSLFGENELSKIDIPVFLQTTNKDLITPLLLEQLPLFNSLNSSDKYLAIALNLVHSRNTLQLVNLVDNQTVSEDQVVQVTNNYLYSLSLLFFQTNLITTQNNTPYLNLKDFNFIEQESFDLYLISSPKD